MVLQRVSQAEVTVDHKVTGRIAHGLVVLLGIEKGDTQTELRWAAQKTAELRIFNDETGKMNRSLQDVGGGVLVISQFTLLGDARKGRRPSYTDAAEPEQAIPLYEYYVQCLRKMNIRTETGIFGAKMSVSLVNEGPVTLIIDRNSSYK